MWALFYMPYNDGFCASVIGQLALHTITSEPAAFRHTRNFLSCISGGSSFHTEHEGTSCSELSSFNLVQGVKTMRSGSSRTTDQFDRHSRVHTLSQQSTGLLTSGLLTHRCWQQANHFNYYLQRYLRANPSRYRSHCDVKACKTIIIWKQNMVRNTFVIVSYLSHFVLEHYLC